MAIAGAMKVAGKALGKAIKVIKKKKKQLEKTKAGKKVKETVKKLLSNPKKLLASLLTGNTLVNIAIGTLAAYYTLSYIDSDLSQSTLLLIEVIISEILKLKNPYI